MILKKRITNLTISAKNGDLESRQKLILENNKLIIKMANITYDEIKKYYMKKNNITLNINQFKLPDNIISLEDIIQDFYEKSLEILDYYLYCKKNIYFSSYLNFRLSIYIKIYALEWFNKIQNIESNYLYLTTYNNSNTIEYKETVDEILTNLKNNDLLQNNIEFVKDILIGINFDDLSKKYNLSRRRLTMKIKYIGLIYNKKKNQVDNVNIKPKYQIKKFNNGSIIKEYKPIIEKLVNEVCNIINKYYKINFEKIKYSFCKYLDEIISNYYIEYKQDTIEFKQIIINLLEKYKIYYLKYVVFNSSLKLPEIFKIKIDNYSFETELISQIKNGNIINIELYRYYILSVVNSICDNDTSLNYSDIYYDLYLIINNLIKEYFTHNKPNINEFNDYFFSILSNYKEQNTIKKNRHIDNNQKFRG